MQGEASWPSCSSPGTRLNDPVSEVDVMKYEQAFLAPLLWQNHLNYPGSSVQGVTIKATLAQTHFKRNNSWSVG